MTLRKVNAGINLVVPIVLLNHAIFLAVWMLSRGIILKPEHNVSWILTGLTFIHAVFSVGFLIANHRENKNHKDRVYSKLNAATIVQRISGVF